MNKQSNAAYQQKNDISTRYPYSTLQILSPDDHLLLTRISNFLDGHLTDETITLPVLAKATFLSRTQLFRRIKKITGKSPSSYIRTLRLQKAISLLKQSDLRISEVAWAVGFRDTSYFSRVFRQEFGLTPSKVKAYD